MTSSPIAMTPIGRVESAFTEFTDVDAMRARPSRLVVDPQLTDGLMGMEPGDWLLVLFFCDRTEGTELQIHPRGDRTRPLRGVFATRSQNRPNPIGATVVELVAIEGNILHVEGLDALDGTPILDIKPYVADFDRPLSEE